jgi:hypothetical protein
MYSRPLGVILLFAALVWGCGGLCVVPPATVIGGSEGHVTAHGRALREQNLPVALPIWLGGASLLFAAGGLLIRPKTPRAK